MKCRTDCLKCAFFVGFFCLGLGLGLGFFFAIQTSSVKAEAAQRRQLKSFYAISEPGRKTQLRQK